MATVNEYLQTRKLKLSTTKTVSAASHLNNRHRGRKGRGALSPLKFENFNKKVFLSYFRVGKIKFHHILSDAHDNRQA